MSERWARSILWTYRWLGAAAYPFIGTYVGWRAAKGKEDPLRRRERYGVTRLPRRDGPLIWIHAASVGEMSAVAPLADHIIKLGINVVLTTGTVTSARMASEKLGGRAIHQYVPLDLKPAVSRFLNHWKPDLAIIAESEIWPMTMLELGTRRVPQVIVNGRLSDRSFDAWRKRAYLAEALMENLAMVMAQSELNAERFRSLGARPVVVTGNLKVDTGPLPVNEEALVEIKTQIGNRKTWAAVSTHEGEEALATDVHKLLRGRHRDLLTIIVPRHADRADALAAEMTDKGLKVARRSRGEALRPDTDILLGDTMGEMGLYLRLTEIAFMGKSMTGEGGQNPLEPAVLDTAILSGKNIQNFRESYHHLIKRGGAKLVRDREMLAGAVNYLLNNPETRAEMIRKAAGAVQEMRGALSQTIAALQPFIHPLVVESRLSRTARTEQHHA